MSDNEKCEIDATIAKNQSQNVKHRSVKDYLNSCQTYNIISAIIAVISITVIGIIGFNECINCFDALKVKEITSKCKPKIYWAYGRNVESGFLKNLFFVLDRLGYEHVPHATDWDLLWAHDYPFRTLYSQLRKLQPHQKVNHFPGCGYITNKVDLATSGLEYIPPAFKLPVDRDRLLTYSMDNPSKQFVQKNNDHRNIKLVKIEDVDFTNNNTFVQEYVDKPLLVSGYKFDIGIYTIITSVDPLRIYIYNGDALLRFCPVKYYPFDPDNLDKYVIGDDYLPPWDVPDLTYYYKTLGFGMKESLNAYLRSIQKDPNLIWKKIEHGLRNTILAKESQIIAAVNRFPFKRNFFEMMRFDFVVDENLDIYLMEANMSPNLSSSHFPPNQLLFEQIIFNLFNLVGVADKLSNWTPGSEEMLTSDKNIAVFSDNCDSVLCRSSCISPTCQLCKPCLSESTRQSLVQAYREHINRGDCKRIFPPPMSPESINLTQIEEYSAENQLQFRWFLGKCQQDSSWC